MSCRFVWYQALSPKIGIQGLIGLQEKMTKAELRKFSFALRNLMYEYGVEELDPITRVRDTD